MTRRFAIVGPGTVGRALARLLREARPACATAYEFVGAAGRRLQSARAACDFVGAGRATTDAAELTRAAELVFITTPDSAIQGVCDELAAAGAFVAGAVVAHCSGALPSAVLASARQTGAHVGSIHPLQTFARPEQAVRDIPDCFCFIEGDEEAVHILQNVALALGAHSVTVGTESKALYHAAAAVASNYLVALEYAALRLMEGAGIRREQALPALLPLIRGTVRNIESFGAEQALTGPLARGDVETVGRHLDAIGRHVPDLLALYKMLGRLAVDVGLARGTLTPDRADELRQLLA